jgi:hypothetical protein
MFWVFFFSLFPVKDEVWAEVQISGKTIINGNVRKAILASLPQP